MDGLTVGQPRQRRQRGDAFGSGGGDHQGAPILEPTDQCAGEIERRRIGPVRVFQHQQQRPILRPGDGEARKDVDQALHRPPVSAAAVRGSVAQSQATCGKTGALRVEPGSLREEIGEPQLPDIGGVLGANSARHLEELCNRMQRAAAKELRAVELHEFARPGRHLAVKRMDQPRFAEACVADDDDAASLPAARLLPYLSQTVERRAAPDQRRQPATSPAAKRLAPGVG